MAPTLLIDIVHDYEKLVERLYRIEAYSELWFSRKYALTAQQIVTGAVEPSHPLLRPLVEVAQRR